MIESRPPLTSPDGSGKRNAQERCSRPMYSRFSKKDFHKNPQRSQYKIVTNIKLEVEDEEPYVMEDDPCKEEEFPPEISSDPGETRDTREDFKVRKKGRPVKVKEEEDVMEISLGEPSIQNPPERCPLPVYFRSSTHEHYEMSQDDENEDFIKVKVKEDMEEPYSRDYELSKEEDIPSEVITGWIDLDEFVSLVQQHRELYDQLHKDYKDNRKRGLIWRRIGAAIYANWAQQTNSQQKATITVLKTKWRSIRDNYRKELLLQRRENRNGSGASWRVPYRHFNLLSFLEPYMDLRETESTYGDDEQEKEALEEEVCVHPPITVVARSVDANLAVSSASITTQDPALKEEEQPARPRYRPRGYPPRRRVQRQPKDDGLVRAINKLSERRSVEETDEYHLAMAMIPLIKQVPVDKRATMTMDMFSVLYSYIPNTPQSAFYGRQHAVPPSLPPPTAQHSYGHPQNPCYHPYPPPHVSTHGQGSHVMGQASALQNHGMPTPPHQQQLQAQEERATYHQLSAPVHGREPCTSTQGLHSPTSTPSMFYQ